MLRRNLCYGGCNFVSILRRSRIPLRQSLLWSAGKCNSLTARSLACDRRVQSEKRSIEAQKVENPTDCSVTTVCSFISDKLNRSISLDSYVSESERWRIVQLLLSSRVSSDSIKLILPEQPVLLKHSHAVWTETLTFLKLHSFQPNQLLPLISGTPSLLSGSSRKILVNVMALLRSFGIADGKRQAIIVGNSQLLLCEDTRPVQQRLSSLLSVFTKAELQKLMLSTPCILTDPWTDTKRKIEYVYQSMGIRSREITNCRLFSHTFLHLVARHQFAERTGAYRMPNKHEIAAREENRPLPTEVQNPTLRELIDLRDAEFVKKIGDVTVDEYHTFVAMMAAEVEEASETEEMSNSDDSDSDLSDDDLQ